jgi:uncharacterized membrane protein SirB2
VTEFYSEVRLVHMLMALASGSLLFIHGLIPMRHSVGLFSQWLRYLRYGVDSILITAALMLTNIVQQYPFINSWLSVKFVLLVVYLSLGQILFYTARSGQQRFIAWLLALITLLYIFSVATTQHEWGVFSLGLGYAGDIKAS